MSITIRRAFCLLPEPTLDANPENEANDISEANLNNLCNQPRSIEDTTEKMLNVDYDEENAVSLMHICSTHVDSHSLADFLQEEMGKVLMQAKLRVHMDGPVLEDIEIWKTFCIYGKITDIRKLGHVAFIMFEKDTEQLDQAVCDLNGSRVLDTNIEVSMITNESICDNAYKSGHGNSSKLVGMTDVFNVDKSMKDQFDEEMQHSDIDANLNTTENTVKNDSESWSSGKCITPDSLKVDCDVRDSMTTDSYIIKYVKAGLHREVASDLAMLHLNGLLDSNLLDQKAIASLTSYEFTDAKKLLARFAENDLKYVENKSAFLCSLMKVYNTAPKRFTQEDARSVIEKYSSLSSMESYSIQSKDLIDTKGQLAETKYTEYIGLGLDEKVADTLCNLYRSGALTSGDIQEETIKNISMYSPKDLSFMVGAFTSKDMSKIKDKDAYLLSMFKKWRCQKKSLNSSITSSGGSSSASYGKSSIPSYEQETADKSVIDMNDVSFLFAKPKANKLGMNKKSFKDIKQELDKAGHEKEMLEVHDGKNVNMVVRDKSDTVKRCGQQADNWGKKKDTCMTRDNEKKLEGGSVDEKLEGADKEKSESADKEKLEGSSDEKSLNYLTDEAHESMFNRYVKVGLSHAVAKHLICLHDGKNLPAGKQLDDRAITCLAKYPESTALQMLDRYSRYKHPELESIHNINAFFMAFLKAGMDLTATDSSNMVRGEGIKKRDAGYISHTASSHESKPPQINEGLLNTYVKLGLSQAVAQRLTSLHDGKHLPTGKMLDSWSVSYLGKYPEGQILEILDSYSCDSLTDQDDTVNALSVNAYFMAFVKRKISNLDIKYTDNITQAEHARSDSLLNTYLKLGLSQVVAKRLSSLHDGKILPADKVLSDQVVEYLRKCSESGVLDVLDYYSRQKNTDLNIIRNISGFFLAFVKNKISPEISDVTREDADVRNEEVEQKEEIIEKRCELFVKEGLNSSVVHEFYKLFISGVLDPYDIDLSNIHFLQQLDISGQLEVIRDLSLKPLKSIRVISQYFNGMMKTRNRQGLNPR